MTKTAKGFTLIELLVVIVIIGILATLATVTLGSARAKARDARRVSDVKQIQTALELFYNDAQGYPGAASIVADSALLYAGVTYMAKIPGNPQPADAGSATVPCATTMSGYAYHSDGTAGANTWYTTYTLAYCLSGTTGSIAAGTHSATPAGIQ